MSYDRKNKQTEITTLYMNDLTSQTFKGINNPFKGRCLGFISKLIYFLPEPQPEQEMLGILFKLINSN